MNKPIAAIEVTSRAIKLVVGNVIDGEVYVLYTLTKKIDSFFDENGQITDIKALIESLKGINLIVDESAKIRIQITDCLLCLPPFGLEVKLFDQYTGVASDELRLSNLDLKSCYNQLKNTMHIPEHAILDIIPRSYELDGGKVYDTFPLGEISHGVQIAGVVHFMPSNTVVSYQNALEGSNISVKKMYTAPFASVELLSTMDLDVNDYFLVDIGSEYTSVSLVGGNTVARSKCFHWGGNNITEKIMSNFNINFDDAEKYKIMYGLDRRILSFKPPICQIDNFDGTSSKHYPDELNMIIKGELDVFAHLLNETMNELLGKRFSDDRTMPLFLVGGGSALLGLRDYIEPKVPNEVVKVITSKTIGARNPAFMNCLGMLLAYAKYPHISDDRIIGAGSLTRKDK